MVNLAFVAAGGAVGSMLRYSLSGLVQRASAGMFPWGTMFVNLAGSFLIGLLWGFFEYEDMSPNARNFIFIGILGGFTTFSTFALENMHLFRDGEIKLAFANILASNIFGILLVFAGFFISRYIINTMRTG